MKAVFFARCSFGFASVVSLFACGDGASSPASSANDAGATSVIDVGGPPARDAGTGGGVATADGGDADVGESGLPSDRFATSVVSVTYGTCAGFGQAKMPGVVLGPPVGGGATQGGLDVASLGHGGVIVLSVAPNAIVDGPGADFIVFENAFNLGGDPARPFAEPGEVSVSDDGVSWRTFPCTATAYPYGACAGWHPTISAPGNGVSPVDVDNAGGDGFDLHDLGVTRARFVRIRDMGSVACDADAGSSGAGATNGFDLDAIAIVNAERP